MSDFSRTLWRRWARNLLFPTLLCFSLCRAYASTGSIGGVVLDATQSVVVGANVLIQSQESGAERSLKTNEIGSYFAPLLPPGTYRIRVSSTGFQTAVRIQVVLRVNETLRMDFAMTLAGQTDSVEVNAQVTSLDVEDAGRSQIIGRDALAGLPLNRRDFLAFTLLSPGVTPPTYGSFSARQGGTIHIGGAREQSNYFLLDGVDNTDPRLQQVSLPPPVEAIDQLRVQSANGSWQSGHLAGGPIDIALKSGTNTMHGSAFGFLRNRHLDARNYFARPACGPDSLPGQCSEKPALDRSQFGGSLGGPLVKNRAFYFLTYEGSRLRQGVPRQSTVPSLAQRQAALDGVPVTERNPAGLATLELYPLPNQSGDPDSNTYTAEPLIDDSADQAVLKLDYRQSDRISLSGHYALVDQRRIDPDVPSGAFTTLPGFGAETPRRSQHAGVGLIHVPSAHSVLSTNFGWHAIEYRNTHQSQGQDISAALGYPTVAENPAYFGHPSVAVAGFDSIGEGTATPAQTTGDVFHFSQQMSIQPGFQGGRHQFRFGGSFRHARQLRSAPLYARGLWNFFGDANRSSLESLVRGLPSSALTGVGDSPSDLANWSWNVYFGDDIRLTRRITLQAGLRYEYNNPPTSQGGPLTVPDLRTESAGCEPKPTCLFVPATSLGLPVSTFHSDRQNFGPRLGLSWRPSGADRLVVRLAYGVFYDAASFGLMSTYSFNPPFFSLNFYPGTQGASIQTIVERQPISSLAAAYRVDPNLRDAYIQQWNSSVQVAFGQDWALDTAYVGSKGTHLSGSTDVNQPPEGGGPRPFPQHGPIASAESRVSSNYHSLQVRLDKRFKQGSTFLAAYTWAKSIDDASLYLGLAQAESYAPQNSRDWRSERALSTFHTAHRLSVSLLQELPSPSSANSLLRGLLASWRVGFIGSFSSGNPFPILRSVDQSGTGAGPLGDQSDRPDVVGDPTQPGPVANHPDPACHLTVSQGGRAADRVKDPASWFNPCAFAAPEERRFGNSARNNVIGPGRAMIDMSLSRVFVITAEGVILQLRLEAFNLFNTPQFDLPAHRFDSARFGAVSTSNALGSSPPRQIQLGLRLQF